MSYEEFCTKILPGIAAGLLILAALEIAEVNRLRAQIVGISQSALQVTGLLRMEAQNDPGLPPEVRKSINVLCDGMERRLHGDASIAPVGHSDGKSH